MGALTKATPDAGSRWPWVRDLTLVGGATAVGAPLAAMAMTHLTGDPTMEAYLAAAGAAGLATGAALGAATPGLITRWLGRLPRGAFICAGVVVGGLWGALVGAAAGFALRPELAWFSALLAAPVGAAQLGWFWRTAAPRRVRRKPMAKFVLAASLAAPALGAAVIVALPHVFH